MKRMLALLLSLAMAFALVACGGNNTAGNNTADGGNTAGNQTEDTTGGDTAEATGSVYYMNFKPEQDAPVAGAGRLLHRADRRARHRGHLRLRRV